MSGVVIRVDGDFAAVERFLAQMDQGLQDMTPMFTEIGDYMVSATQGRMNRGLQPSGAPQKPVQRGGTPLVDTGVHLRDRINREASSDQVVIGPNNVVFAAIHQFGGKAGRGHQVTIPARPYLGVGPEDELEIGDIVADFIEAAA